MAPGEDICHATLQELPAIMTALRPSPYVAWRTLVGGDRLIVGPSGLVVMMAFRRPSFSIYTAKFTVGLGRNLG